MLSAAALRALTLGVKLNKQQYKLRPRNDKKLVLNNALFTQTSSRILYENPMHQNIHQDVINYLTCNKPVGRVPINDDICVASVGNLYRSVVTKPDPTSHEAAIGLDYLNNLRNQIPNFSLIYGHSDNTTYYEYIPGLTLDQYRGNKLSNLYLQVLFSLDMAWKKFGFYHADLHSHNIIVRELPKPITIKYDLGIVTTNTIATIIDYDASAVNCQHNTVLSDLYNLASDLKADNLCRLFTKTDPAVVLKITARSRYFPTTDTCNSTILASKLHTPDQKYYPVEPVNLLHYPLVEQELLANDRKIGLVQDYLDQIKKLLAQLEWKFDLKKSSQIEKLLGLVGPEGDKLKTKYESYQDLYKRSGCSVRDYCTYIIPARIELVLDPAVQASNYKYIDNVILSQATRVGLVLI